VKTAGELRAKKEQNKAELRRRKNFSTDWFPFARLVMWNECQNV
jgi:hypothetical protein